jgi:hypothetical protein
MAASTPTLGSDESSLSIGVVSVLICGPGDFITSSVEQRMPDFYSSAADTGTCQILPAENALQENIGKSKTALSTSCSQKSSSTTRAFNHRSSEYVIGCIKSGLDRVQIRRTEHIGRVTP